ncbi:retinol dehydrogenase 8-like [Diadema setosum]|uniref:retinol dehydrogenase 8-like n=1 Tax=Diadema setosum TaxID=31175 RepID=UPI003B3A9ADB
MAQRVVLITGCSSGIGQTMAVKLAKDAAKKYLVIPTMRNLEKRKPLEEAAGSTLNDTMHIEKCDVQCEKSVQDAVENVVNKFGRIDVLINNAGIASFTPMEYMPIEDMKELFDTNLFGMARMLQAVLPHMKEQKTGHIISTSSVTGIGGYPMYDVYSASKFAIEGLSEALACRLKDHNIRVCTIVPGPVETNINTNIVDGNRIPDKAKVDPITKRQLKNILTHQKFNFAPPVIQSAEEVADIAVEILDKNEVDIPPKIFTSDYSLGISQIKNSDLDGMNWLEYIRNRMLSQD